MKKIRFSDNTELEIYNISCSGNTLTVEVLNGNSTDIETLFKDSDNLAVIQYYVGTELMKGYSGYTQLQKYEKRMDQTISTDYSTTDSSTESGFAEEKADISVITIVKPEKIETVADQTEQNAADIAFLAMESGVDLYE